MNNQEIEIKYYITDLAALEQRVKKLGAKLEHERVLETNLRFDTRDSELIQSYRVLRLRKDEKARLTFKGPGRMDEGVKSREEIEFTVSDFDQAKAFLEALGYQVIMSYEKYRTTYALEGVEVTLDELPYGNFAELEGPDVASIQKVSERLGLDWETGISESYTTLFSLLKSKQGLQYRDLSFENFKSRKITPADLNVRPADRPA